MTNEIIKKTKNLIVVEIDERLIPILNDRFVKYRDEELSDVKFTIINDDILKIDLSKLIDENKMEGGKVKVVANLPYYISTPIIIKLIEQKEIDEIYVMLQNEVAERLCAKTGSKDSGAITYLIEYNTCSKKEILVSKENFKPVPKVDSAVISLKRKDEKDKIKVKDQDIMHEIIRKGFQQRRKTFLNSMSDTSLVIKEELREILIHLNIPETIRAEKLRLEDFAKIADEISDKKEIKDIKTFKKDIN